MSTCSRYTAAVKGWDLFWEGGGKHRKLQANRSVSPKCQSVRGMHGHSNKIKQEFGLTDFPKVRETIRN